MGVGDSLKTIRARLKALGMSQRELATALGVTENTVSRWLRPREAGRITLTLDRLEQIAGVLGITVSGLMGVEVVAEIPTEYVAGPARVPLYVMGHIAGTTDAEGHQIDNIEVGSRQARLADSAFVVQGSSMEPWFVGGDIVGIRRQAVASKGQLVIARADGELTFKRYDGLVGEKNLLTPLNRDHDAIIADEIQIVGIYRWLLRESRDGKI